MPPVSDSSEASHSTRKSKESNAALAETAASTLSLLQNVLSSLRSPAVISESVPIDSPDPLEVVCTAATLLKAHTTKLSLLVINKPFTPSAIRKVISDVASTCIPAMTSAVQICQPDSHGEILHDEIRALVANAFAELEHMLQDLLSYLSSLSADETGKQASSRDSLTSTGVLWGACDQLIALKGLRLAGLAVRKALLYRSMIEDAMSELQEWMQEDEDGEDEFAVSEGEDDDEDVDDIFGFGGKMPSDDPGLREALENSLRKLRQVKSLYSSIVKYRLEALNIKNGCSKAVVQKVDELMDNMRRIPERVDEMAGSFYELDSDESRKLMEEICKKSKDAAEVMKLNWTGEEDDFTAWAGVWLKLIDQA